MPSPKILRKAKMKFRMSTVERAWESYMTLKYSVNQTVYFLSALFYEA